MTGQTFEHADLDQNGVLDATEFNMWIKSGQQSAELVKTILEAVGGTPQE